MAQNLEKEKQISPDKNILFPIGDNHESQSSDHKPPLASRTSIAKHNPKDKETRQRFDRFNSQRSSKSFATHPLAEGTTQVASQRYQPSRVFAQKCFAELQSILESIKVDYHEEIKQLYVGEESHLYTDLVIRIGDEAGKSLHKCILASRAYKFYSALKLFRRPEENHIIVCQFQAQENQGPKDKPGELSPEDQIAKQLREKQRKEALEFLECILPEDLIRPEILLNFLRRAYFDHDLLDEETQLNRKLINWLRANKPELIQTDKNKTSKIQPDSRESFRTIQQDIDQLSLTERTNSPATTEFSTTTDSAFEGTISKMDQQEGAEETLQTPSLTRTETFELLTKNDNNSSIGSPAPTAQSLNRSTADNLTDDDESRRQTANDSESSEAYAPTTRTGLKPKKFTTPVGMKSVPRSKQAQGSLDSSGNIPTPTSKSSSFNRTGSVGKSTPTTRRLSGSTNVDEARSPPESRSQIGQLKPKISTPVGRINKPTIIPRAHPISMERFQSPSKVANARAKPKNFIAANKKLVSQMEKKIGTALGAANSSGDQSTKPLTPVGNYDSENENSDASFLALEPLTTDNIAAQLDRFTLVSCSKLAEALSRMFIGEFLTDTIILVNGGHKQISAHKCILAARSAYLNDVINKQSLPSNTSEAVSGNQAQLAKIDLSEFTYPVVYFSIMHIYSGIVKVPDDLEQDELAKLSHLLHVGTLRQVCIHNLRMNYCHYFHKPCSVCCLGVLKTLPLAWRYDYTELYSKCLQWIGSHFAQIFCLEEFSNLKPHDLIEECYKATLSQLTPDNVIQKTIECQRLLKSLPRVKWTESIICMVGRQLEDFCHYVAENYERILRSESFLALGKSCWECEVLEENLLAAMNHLKPDSGCKTLIQLDKIECSIEPMGGGFSVGEDGLSNKGVSESFANLIAKMRKYCERFLLKEAAAVVHSPSWKQMHPTLQKRIKDQALLSTDFDEPTKNLAAKPKLPSMAKQQGSRMSPSSPQPRLAGGTSSPGTKSPSDPSSRLKSPNATYLPPPKNKPSVARHVKVLK